MSNKRAISSVILVGFVFFIILFLPEIVFNLMLTLFIGLGLYEFYTLLEKKAIPVNRPAGILLGAGLPFLFFFKLDASVVIVVYIAALFILQFTRRQNNSLLALSAALFGILYIGYCLSFMVKLRQMPGGIERVVFLILVTKFGDTGAYLIGTRWGRHKLMPRLSPNKSIEGGLAGLVFSVCIAFLISFLLPGMKAADIAIIGFGLGVLALVGDLAESLLKRDCQVKDSGKSIPGLGGVLDTIDSLIFTTPFFYFYLKFLQ